MSDGPVLSDVVVAAFQFAARERPPGFPLTTGRVLAALSRVDMASDWQRIWLHTGDPAQSGLAESPDDPYRTGPAASIPPTPAEGWADGVRALNSLPKWEGVPTSERLAAALALAGRIGDAYRMGPVPSGVMALALVADPGNGAARALLHPGLTTHGQLLGLIQADLLDTRLEGVETVIASARPRSAPPVAAAAAAAPGPSAPSAGPRVIRKARAAPASGAAPTAVTANLTAAADGVAYFPWLRWRTRRWRLLAAICLALIVVGLFWHREFLPPPSPLVLPPYPVPAVAHQVLTTAALPKAGGGGWLQFQDGPPDGGLFVGTGRFRADLRRAVFVGAWQRSWVTADGQGFFEVTAYEARTRSLALSSVASKCKPQRDASLPGTLTAGYVTRDAGSAHACATAIRGRTALVLAVASNGPNAAAIAWAQLTAGLARQVPQVPATAQDQPLPNGWNSDLRTAINSSLMGIVLGIPILLGLGTVLRDRSTWRRLRSFFAFAKARQSFSVDQLVNVRLARHGALVLVRLAWLAWTMRATEDWHLGLWQSGGVLAAAIAAMLAAEWLIRRRHPAPWRPAVFAGGRLMIGAAALLISAAVAGAGIYLAMLGAVFRAFGTGPDGMDLLIAQTGRDLPVVGVVLIFAALLPFTLARRLGMRALRNQASRERSADEERHPVLMLRSFADDRRLLRARRFDRASIAERLCMRRFERFEEVTASALAVYGPVLALSQVGEKLPPPLGAERRSFSMDDWRDRIRELLGTARLVCVTVGRSKSLLWEIEQIRDAGILDRAIFVLPPTSKAEQRRRLSVLAHALGADYALLDQTWPGSDVLAIVFPDGVTPVVVTGRAQNDVGYEAAIGAWAIAITADTRSFPADLRRLSGMFAAYATSDHALAPGQAPLPMRWKPRPVIYDPGKAPVYKPWSRRLVSWRVLPWTLSLLIFPLIAKFALAGVLPAATMHAKYSATALTRDPGAGTVYAVLGGRLLATVDFKSQQLRGVAVAREYIKSLVVTGPNAYYTAPGNGRVGRVSLSTGRTIWDQPVPVGVRSLVVTDGQVVVVSPATDQLIELSAADGHVVARRHLAGAPFGIAESAGRLYVTLARAGQVTELNPQGLAVVATVSVPAGPREIFTDGKRVWVLCLLAHELVSLGPRPQPKFSLSRQTPLVSSSGGWLAIQGQEWVTALSPSDIVTRLPLEPSGISALVVQADGSVIVGYDSGELDKLSPVKL
jgi:hypothetical protein